MVVNNTPQALNGYKARVQIYNLDGTKKYDQTTPVSDWPPRRRRTWARFRFPADLSPVHFVKLELRDAAGQLVSDNFYWRETKPDDFTALDTIADVTLDATIARHDAEGKVAARRDADQFRRRRSP